MSDVVSAFGKQLRARRILAKLSGVELAAKTGIDEEALTLWEEGDPAARAPSLEHIDLLATALGVTNAHLMAPPANDLEDGVVVCRVADRERTVGARGGQDYYVYEKLARSRTCPDLVPLAVTVLQTAPAAPEFNAGHDSREFIFVLSGEIDAYWGDKANPRRCVLSPGDSLYIAPGVPHAFRSAGAVAGQLVAVNF